MNIFKYSLIAASLIVVTGCSESDDTSELVKAVELEAQRANGTIIESMTFEGGNVRLKKGESRQLKAWGTDSKGDVRDITEEVTWTSANTEVATISDKGLVTAVAELSENQGIVEFTATTINDIADKTELSISGVKASGLEVIELEEQDTEVVMCLNAQLGAKVTYEDGYISEANTLGLSWSIDESDIASISEQGVLRTYGQKSQDITISAEHTDGVSEEQIFRASIDALSSISFKNDEDIVTQLQLELSERVTLTTELVLIDQTTHDISENSTWLSRDQEVVAVSNEDETKGNLVALTVGTADIIASCGGISESINVAVTGDSTLEGITINDGVDKLSFARGETIDLTVYADLKGTTSDLNVSEFAEWNLGDTDLASGEIKKAGTKDAYFALKAAENVIPGEFNLLVFYQGQSLAIPVTVE